MSQNKFKQQRFITQSLSDRSNTWSFYVLIRKNGFEIRKAFSEKEYGSPRNAYDNAVAFRDKTLMDIQKDVYVSKTNKTALEVLNESYDIFPVSAETKRKHTIYYKKFPHINIQDVNAETIQKHLVQYIYNASDEKIQRIFSIWKRIMQTAIIKNYITRNYCEGVIIPKSKKVLNPIKNRSRTKDNFLKALEVLEKDGDHTSKSICGALKLMYYTGIRPAECFCLLKKDIDFKENLIYISKQLGSDNDNFNVVMPTKTKLSNRIIPLANSFGSELKKLVKLSSGDYLFSDLDGNHYNVPDVTEYIHKKLNNKVDFHMYDLRHLFSTDLIKNGIDAKTHQELMGHSNYRMSVYYADSSIDQKIKALENR